MYPVRTSETRGHHPPVSPDAASPVRGAGGRMFAARVLAASEVRNTCGWRVEKLGAPYGIAALHRYLRGCAPRAWAPKGRKSFRGWRSAGLFGRYGSQPTLAVERSGLAADGSRTTRVNPGDHHRMTLKLVQRILSGMPENPEHAEGLRKHALALIDISLEPWNDESPADHKG
jgi:hypothetical protein